jgi:hypothetical protein
MKRTILALTLLALPALVSAEEPEKPFRYNGSGYAYFNIGACQHGYRLVGGGGGGEAFLWRGLTVGGDAGYHQFSDGWGFGLLTLNLGYHFVDRKKPKKVDPFVTLSLLGGAVGSQGGFAGGGYLGGGLNYWFKERIGLRTEVRLNVAATEEIVTAFYIGVSFR